MPFFVHILDFKRTFLARLRNKRSHPRHRVGAEFPLKASLALAGAEKFNPDKAPVRGSGLIWSGSVGNISENGLNILLSPAAISARGEPTYLRLVLEDQELVIPCTVAHFRVHSRHALCGIRLEFDDFATQKAYQQIVSAVKLGASFSAAGPARKQAGMIRQTWRSTNRTVLSEWRDSASRQLVRFEMNLAGHLVQGLSLPPGLVVQDRTDPAAALSQEVDEEVGLLYRWVVGNLPRIVPSDLRALMSRNARPSPPAPAISRPFPVSARAYTATIIKVPTSTWRSPQFVPSGPDSR